MDTSNIIDRIIWTNTKISEFWSNSYGWAPENAASIMSKSRLDWQISLSNSLKHWIADNQITDGDLILAWTNLGALIEGTLKLFLCVYYSDYSLEPEKMKNGKIIDPDVLQLETLKTLFKNKVKISSQSYDLIENVQQRRNAIHAYKNRHIGNYNEFLDCLHKYLLFLDEINKRLPYPDDRGNFLIIPEKDKYLD